MSHPFTLANDFLSSADLAAEYDEGSDYRVARLMRLLGACDKVIAIHGCKVAGEVVLVGGLDKKLAAELGAAMTKAGLDCHLEGHDFPGTHLNNICNRSRHGAGVQLELSAALRASSPQWRKLVAVVRSVLL